MYSLFKTNATTSKPQATSRSYANLQFSQAACCALLTAGGVFAVGVGHIPAPACLIPAKNPGNGVPGGGLATGVFGSKLAPALGPGPGTPVITA